MLQRNYLSIRAATPHVPILRFSLFNLTSNPMKRTIVHLSKQLLTYFHLVFKNFIIYVRVYNRLKARSIKLLTRAYFGTWFDSLCILYLSLFTCELFVWLLYFVCINCTSSRDLECTERPFSYQILYSSSYQNNTISRDRFTSLLSNPS